MAKYKDIYGNITEVGSPELNPELIAGKTLVPENTPLTTSDKISSTILQPATTFTPPTKPEDKTNYAGLTANGQAMIDFLNKQMPSTPPAEPTDWFTQFNPETMYKNLYEQGGLEAKSQDVIAKQSTVKQAQNELALLNAQMAGITAESQAVPIRLQQEATGRGITAGGLAPIQAGQLREIALRSLPLQAQILGAQAKVQSAQGDVDTANQTLALAQDKINTLFKFQSDYAAQKYNYDKELRDRYYQQASDKQKLVLQQLQKEDDRSFQIEQDNRNNARALSLKAMENGQGALAGQITALDPKSPTFITDLQKLQGQIAVKDKNVENLMQKYPDAGISATDNISVAQSKLKNSRIYQEQIRLPKYAMTDTAGGSSYTLPNLGGAGNNMIFIPDTKLTSVQKQKVNTVVAGTDLINQAEQLYNDAVGKEYQGFGSGVISRIKGLGRFAGSMIGTNEAWKAYQNFLDSNRAPIAKGIKGEVGNLAENEQINALKSFPGAFTSPYEAKIAFQAIRAQAQSNLRTLGTLDSSVAEQPQEAEFNLDEAQLRELKDMGLIE